MDTIDDEIKKLSRKWLVELVGFLSLENLVVFRDALDAIADVVHDQIKLMQKAQEKRMYRRPPVETVREFDAMLRTYVNSDIKPEERWSEIQTLG